MNPSILLVRPQMGENIGAAARAMACYNALYDAISYHLMKKKAKA